MIWCPHWWFCSPIANGKRDIISFAKIKDYSDQYEVCVNYRLFEVTNYCLDTYCELTCMEYITYTMKSRGWFLKNNRKFYPLFIEMFNEMMKEPPNECMHRDDNNEVIPLTIWPFPYDEQCSTVEKIGTYPGVFATKPISQDNLQYLQSDGAKTLYFPLYEKLVSYTYMPVFRKCDPTSIDSFSYPIDSSSMYLRALCAERCAELENCKYFQISGNNCGLCRRLVQVQTVDGETEAVAVAVDSVDSGTTVTLVDTAQVYTINKDSVKEFKSRLLNSMYVEKQVDNPDEVDLDDFSLGECETTIL